MVDQQSGFIRGGSALFRMIAAVQAGMGQNYACPVNYVGNTVFLDLSDIRMFEVLEETAKLSDERRVLEALLKPGDTFVDIGANHGSYSLMASGLVGASGLIVAFEPQERLAGLIEKSLTASNTSDFRVFSLGCSNWEGSVNFYVPKRASGSAGLFPGFSGIDRHRMVTVEVTTLDICLSQLRLRQQLFIKLDVEGSEYDALLGAKTTIARHRPAVLFEVNPSSSKAAGRSIKELFSLLFDLGYNEVSEISEFPLRRNINDVDKSRQRNLLALHKDYLRG